VRCGNCCAEIVGEVYPLDGPVLVRALDRWSMLEAERDRAGRTGENPLRPHPHENFPTDYLLAGLQTTIRTGCPKHGPRTCRSDHILKQLQRNKDSYCEDAPPGEP